MEIQTAPRLRLEDVTPDNWRQRLEVAEEQKGLVARTDIHLGHVDGLAPDQLFDAATLIGVLHHQPGEEAKRQLLRSVASRLRPGARSRGSGTAPSRARRSPR